MRYIYGTRISWWPLFEINTQNFSVDLPSLSWVVPTFDWVVKLTLLTITRLSPSLQAKPPLARRDRATFHDTASIALGVASAFVPMHSSSQRTQRNASIGSGGGDLLGRTLIS